jgi:phosphoribosyl 1,2-cyclic phosphodiesterase
VEVVPLASSSAANCTLVRHAAGPTILLDAGLTVRELRPLLGFQVTSLEAALITHAHQDHARGVESLLQAGVTCAMRVETAEVLGVAKHHRVRILAPQDHVTPRGPYMFGPWAVVPFAVDHDLPNLGFVLATRSERLLYLTDTPFSRYRFEGLTHVLVEANHSVELVLKRVEEGALEAHVGARIIRSHLGLERALELLKSNDLSRVQEIWLMHLSAGNSDAAAFKAAVERATGVPTRVAAERIVA